MTKIDSNNIKKPQQGGTQSPPLEATGEDKPMGLSSVDGSGDTEWVSDGQQREQYFAGSDAHKRGDTKDIKKSRPEKMGQSLADTMDKSD